jgi:archaellum component FlaC
MSDQLLQQILTELKNLHLGQQELRMEQKGVRNELQEIRSEQKGVRDELQEIGSEMQHRFDTLELKMSLIEKDVKEMKNELRIVKEQTACASELAYLIEELKKQVAEHHTDIQMIKQVITNK